jgi:hypothetical protein
MAVNGCSFCKWNPSHRDNLAISKHKGVIPGLNKAFQINSEFLIYCNVLNRKVVSRKIEIDFSQESFSYLKRTKNMFLGAWHIVILKFILCIMPWGMVSVGAGMAV